MIDQSFIKSSILMVVALAMNTAAHCASAHDFNERYYQVACKSQPVSCGYVNGNEGNCSGTFAIETVVTISSINGGEWRINRTYASHLSTEFSTEHRGKWWFQFMPAGQSGNWNFSKDMKSVEIKSGDMVEGHRRFSTSISLANYYGMGKPVFDSSYVVKNGNQLEMNLPLKCKVKQGVWGFDGLDLP